MLSSSSILITGGTGSFGHTFVPMTLEKYNPRRLVIFSRDEMKHWEMAKDYANDERVRFFVGDVRDKDRLSRALRELITSFTLPRQKLFQLLSTTRLSA